MSRANQVVADARNVGLSDKLLHSRHKRLAPGKASDSVRAGWQCESLRAPCAFTPRRPALLERSDAPRSRRPGPHDQHGRQRPAKQ